MSLRVWLPLNGDLHNQGIGDLTATLMGTGITWTAGKIGQAATFPNSCASCIHLPGLKLQILSWACWFKCTGEGSGSSQRILSEGRDTGSVGTNIWVSKAGTTLYWSAHKVTGSTTVSLNTWYHIVLVCDGSKVHLYLNGEEKGTGTAYSEDSDYAQSNDRFVIGKMAYSYTATGNYFPFCGQINDVRIYDHALSAAEVKEIAQGLVLHYKLDSGLFGNPNLALDTNTSTNRWNLSMQTGDKTNSIEYEGTTPISVITRGSTAQSGWRFLGYSTIDRNAIKTATDYTVSFDIHASVEGTIGFTGIVQSNAQNYLTASTSIVQNTVIANQWNHIILQCHTKDSFENISISSQIIYLAPSNNFYNVGAILKFKNMKFEEGLATTPWCPADSEMNIDRTIVEDSSGYNHNGEILNDVLISSDTPRYSTSINLVAGNSAINCGRGGMVTDSITVNLWIKTSAWANPVSCTEGGGWNFESSGDYFRFPIYISGVGYKYGISATKRTELCDNQWHMLTGMYDRINGHIKIYVDGELDNDYNAGTTNAIGYHGSNVIWLGAEASGSSTAIGSNGMAGLFSDFRIYCTPLLDTDIKQLYNVSMKIDKNQNIHNFETVEDGQNKITKKGQLKCANIIEYINGQAYRGPQNDPNIYIEPDGSCWIRIFHHNNPASYLFTSTDNFLANVYKDENRWFNFNICYSVHEHEFIARVKRTKDDTERAYRWIQSTNPLIATFDQTKVANITKISGYDIWPLGGLYKLNSSTYLTANNGTNGNWFGATGCWTTWNGGIPGWASTSANDAITTGYVDIYLRIDSDVTPISIVPNTVQSKKNNLWLALEAIER